MAFSILPVDSSVSIIAAYFLIVLALGYLLVSQRAIPLVARISKADGVFQYHAYATDFPEIRNLPEVGGALPFVGHLKSLGGRRNMNDATVYSEWASQLDTDVFQCRLGNQRTVVVCSWEAMKEVWIANSSALSDRPDQPGFVEKLGVDITGTSLTEQIRKCRAAAMRALGKAKWPNYYSLVEPTSVALVRDMFVQGENGKVPTDVYCHLRHVVFDLALSMTYGARFGEVQNDFMETFLWSINAVSAVRNSTKTYRHFVPLLRWMPESTSETIRAETVRSKHVEVLYRDFQHRVEAGEELHCILSSLRSDKLTEEELHGTCISLLQAAPDTVASGIYMCIAWLSSTPEGLSFQEELHDSILDAYNGDSTAAWHAAFREEKVPLLVSLYKETLRFFTIAPFSIPRKTSSPMRFRDSVIPKGVSVILNSQAVNHDLEHFGPDAWAFNPKRFLDSETPLPSTAFGAGARICPAVGISNRLVYAVVLRLVLGFRMNVPKEGEGRRACVHPVGFSDVFDQVVSGVDFP